MKKQGKIIVFLYSCLFILSCTDHIVKGDKNYDEVSKLKDTELSILSTPHIINVDTIKSDNKIINLELLNSGDKPLKKIKIIPYCKCITIPFHKTVILPNEKMRVKINMSLPKKGNFSYPIYIYGGFYPYMRIVLVEGFHQ